MGVTKKKSGKSLLMQDESPGQLTPASPMSRMRGEHPSLGREASIDMEGAAEEVKKLDFEEVEEEEKRGRDEQTSSSDGSEKQRKGRNRASSLTLKKVGSKKEKSMLASEEREDESDEEEGGAQSKVNSLSSNRSNKRQSPHTFASPKKPLDYDEESTYSSDEGVNDAEVMRGLASFSVLDPDQEVEVVKRSFSLCHSSFKSKLHLRMLKRFLRKYEREAKWAARSTASDAAFADAEFVLSVSSFLPHLASEGMPTQLDLHSLALHLRVLAVVMRLPSTGPILSKHKLTPLDKVQRVLRMKDADEEVQLGAVSVLTAFVQSLPDAAFTAGVITQLLDIFIKCMGAAGATTSPCKSSTIAVGMTGLHVMAKSKVGVDVFVSKGVIEYCRDMVGAFSHSPRVVGSAFGVLRHLVQSQDCVTRLLVLDGIKSPEGPDSPLISRALHDFLDMVYELRDHRECTVEVLLTLTRILWNMKGQAIKVFRSEKHIKFLKEEILFIAARQELAKVDERYVMSTLEHVEAISASAASMFENDFCALNGLDALCTLIGNVSVKSPHVLSNSFTVLQNLITKSLPSVSKALRKGQGATILLDTLVNLAEKGADVSFASGIAVLAQVWTTLLTDYGMFSWTQEHGRRKKIEKVATSGVLEVNISDALFGLVEKDQLWYNNRRGSK
uniref:Uncharacterized protein n=1 Tax=Palpitomonas bilix TaxID=652834 RepID=A0A7S3D1W9_9EUKA|mmetsp:Transcript_18383/g.46116  ORF Transcript_18383/g.46116 Transcript_18383/m.46116 type:complete len:672 (+) Transcript_18383:72-2087(+)|eukprot:CAMPEP_0113896986 /NCGR_PEP_ID=MMETSP0780_2-20120614/18376_1 /TAXON_ID=652834 /ORGANISM="Palpitomonas bilix" /LENGTH=671 /DNA_ID=CAMNT_0000888295 /DNA_START=28 /DNA_END=2043 /DNA_ORIENTATION=- /assembly_acc=CAM_ASM_000599